MWVRMTDRMFRIFEFVQDYINDTKVIAPKKSKRFYVIKSIEVI